MSGPQSPANPNPVVFFDITLGGKHTVPRAFNLHTEKGTL